MTKPFPMQPLVNLAQQKNEAATRKLGQLNRQQQDAQAKLDALLQYRKDYQQKFQDAARSGMSQADLSNFQNFIQRLDEAIAQQRGIVEKAASLVNNGRSELQDAQRKMKSFDALAQRHADGEKRREAKNEQRQTDEHAVRAAAAKPATLPD